MMLTTLLIVLNTILMILVVSQFITIALICRYHKPAIQEMQKQIERGANLVLVHSMTNGRVIDLAMDKMGFTIEEKNEIGRKHQEMMKKAGL